MASRCHVADHNALWLPAGFRGTHCRDSRFMAIVGPTVTQSRSFSWSHALKLKVARAMAGISIASAASFRRPARCRRQASSEATPRHGRFDHVIDVRASSSLLVNPRPTEEKARTLTAYMQLPVSQYELIEMPMQASLTRLKNDRTFDVEDGADMFELVVPPLKFPGLVSVQPCVICSVQASQSVVVIKAKDCTLAGADAESFRLNDLFEFSVVAEIKWVDESHKKEVQCESEIQITVDPPSIFRFMPRKLLEKIGRAAVGVTLRALQTSFLRSLVADYERWAVDDVYKDERARACAKRVYNGGTGVS